MNRLRLTAVILCGLSLAPFDELAYAAQPARVAEQSAVDLNTASQTELQALEGVGSAVARRIIEHRPYRSVEDLAKAGLGPARIARLKSLVTVAAPRASTRFVRQRGSIRISDSGTVERLDINTARLEDLQNLPGVGPDLGARLMAGRPYRTIDDLTRNEIPLSTIEKIRPLVFFGPEPPYASPPLRSPLTAGRDPLPPPAAIPNLNTASTAELRELLDISPELARWIVRNRPYVSVDDLVEAGIPSATLDRIRLLLLSGQLTASAIH